MKNTLIKTILCLVTLTFTACSYKEMDKDDDTAQEASTYNLVEKRQRVIRYNCQNIVVSDQIESVQTPVYHVSIRPNSFTGLESSTFYNATTGKSAPSITSHTDFTIDLNPGALNMEVDEGINQIDYKFMYCDSYLPNSTTCAQALTVKESGSIFIDVTYEKIDVPGVQTVTPNPQDCTAQ